MTRYYLTNITNQHNSGFVNNIEQNTKEYTREYTEEKIKEI